MSEPEQGKPPDALPRSRNRSAPSTSGTYMHPQGQAPYRGVSSEPALKNEPTIRHGATTTFRLNHSAPTVASSLHAARRHRWPIAARPVTHRRIFLEERMA